MELFYNPDRMPEEEIKATFVAREALVDELFELVKGQPDGAGVQHAVIIAPRGMGKTTVLLMVKFAIKDRGLSDQWQAVKFPEESYGIYDLSDFWLETLSLIAADTSNPELDKLVKDLKIKYPKNDDLQEAAYAALKDWRRKHGKRLLLLVENFDQILEQINDERDNARLRDVLMNDGTVMLLGGATTFFKEARAYDQPLYNFFKIYNLADLQFVQMQDLLRRRAELDSLAEFEKKLKENASRLRTLEYFTGGNPRLVLMLYRVVSHSDVTEVRRALEKLLDEVTPYYKAKVETLPPQQRKILDYIARISSETNEGVTPKEIAEAVRLPQNQVGAQLKRLTELGYVRAANLRGRSSWYTLSEPLYAIWHQMRFGRDARERMGWLVNFMKVWYAADEFGLESEQLEVRFRDYFNSNRTQEALDILEHHHYLVRAMGQSPDYVDGMSRVIYAYLDFGNIAMVKKELLQGARLEYFSNEVLNRLHETGCIDAEQLNLAITFKLPVSRPFIRKGTKTEVSAEQFYSLLAGLDSNIDIATRKYVALHQELASLFRRRGHDVTADELADETLNRVACKLIAGQEISELESVAKKVAHYVLLDVAKRPQAVDVDNIDIGYIDDHVDIEDRGDRGDSYGKDAVSNEIYECFEHCLQRLSLENQDLLIRYYQGDKDWLKKNRLALATELGITSKTLQVRVMRLRSTLEVCINKCLGTQPQAKEIRSTPDEWDEIARLLTLQIRSRQVDQQEVKSRLTLVSPSQAEVQEQRIREQLIDLLAVIQSGNFRLASQLITETEMEEQFFPLVRAIEYLRTNDEALIEKLSPEMRGIVEEVVAKLKSVAPSAQAADT